MVWQQALYLVNLLCKFVPCDYHYPYPDTSLSEPQAYKDLISIGIDDKDRDKGGGGTLRIDGVKDVKEGGWGWTSKEGEFDYTGNDPLVVVTKTGKLRGFWMRVVGGRKIRAWEGIPYAESPVAYFRFSEPSPKVPWSGLLWANKKGPKCLQFSQIEFKQRIVGSEECLFLNVYAPKIQENPLSKDKMKDKFPVIVFIHGGGFEIGAGTDYGPSYLLQQDVILVTFNYRLGVFGFLSTGDASSPGNYGLKDQALCLKWISENIEAFHGDPMKITLLGQEAGGASVHLQMMSDRSKPYFQGAIAMSGSAFGSWVFHTKDQAHHLTKYFAKKFNCPVHSSEAIISCLRRVDGAALARTQIKFLNDLPIPLYLFRPVLESMEQKEVPFITEIPEELYRKGQVAGVPFITGFTEDEGLTFLLPLVFRGTIRQIRRKWNHVAPDFLDYEHLKVDKDEITKKINWLYFKASTPETTSIKTFSDALSLRFTVTGIHKALQAHSTLGAPTYAYMFSYNGKYNLATMAGIKPWEWGVGQGEDTFYLLNSTHLYQGFKKADHELILAKIMVNLFGNFAAKRVPAFTLENGEDFNLWQPITDPRNMSYLLIHKKIKMIPEPYLKQTVYWESLGLPDTTPYINSTEHYRDFHFITSTPQPQPPPGRGIYIPLGSAEDPSSPKDPKPYLQPPEGVEESEPSEGGGGGGDDDDNSKENDATTTTTSTTPRTTTLAFDEENEIFLPPWNPQGMLIPKFNRNQELTSTTTTTPTPEPHPQTNDDDDTSEEEDKQFSKEHEGVSISPKDVKDNEKDKDKDPLDSGSFEDDTDENNDISDETTGSTTPPPPHRTIITGHYCNKSQSEDLDDNHHNPLALIITTTTTREPFTLNRTFDPPDEDEKDELIAKYKAYFKQDDYPPRRPVLSISRGRVKFIITDKPKYIHRMKLLQEQMISNARNNRSISAVPSSDPDNPPDLKFKPTKPHPHPHPSNDISDEQPYFIMK